MRTLLINAAEPEECRVALIDDGRLEGYRVERSGSVTLVGNVYRGRIVNMESSIGAAFVDIDCGRNAFLHVSDCVGVRPEDRTPIEEHVQLGEDVLVQVTRDSVGPKGPVLTANLSLPGRFLVLLPFSEGGGISRRIAEEDNRTKLRGIVRELEEQAGAGLIVRTAGAERTKRELSRDLKALTRLWESIRTRATDGSGPALLHAEADLAVRALRDMLDDEVEEIVLDDPVVLKRVEETLNAWQPELTGRLRLHDDPRPLFHAYDLELQIDRLGARRVRLPSGGTIVFDQTEALLAVDVNSGRTREEELEETARRTNLEAATEIARQLRLRDLGGVVAVDFIDMREDEHIREVESVFKAALKKDRARVRPARLGSFGIFVLTRRRAGAAGASASRPCPLCGGGGRLPMPEVVALRVFRELAARAAGRGRAPLRARLSPEASGVLELVKRGALKALRDESGRSIEVVADASFAPEQWKVETVRST